MGKFSGQQGIFVFESDPLGARQVRRRDDVGAFSQFGEVFRGSFEGETDRRRLKGSDGKHLPANLEEKIAAPLNLLGRAREGEAELAKPVDIHGQQSRTEARATSMGGIRQSPCRHRSKTIDGG